MNFRCDEWVQSGGRPVLLAVLLEPVGDAAGGILAPKGDQPPSLFIFTEEAKIDRWWRWVQLQVRRGCTRQKRKQKNEI